MQRKRSNTQDNWIKDDNIPHFEKQIWSHIIHFFYNTGKKDK